MGYVPPGHTRSTTKTFRPNFPMTGSRQAGNQVTSHRTGRMPVVTGALRIAKDARNVASTMERSPVSDTRTRQYDQARSQHTDA